MDSSLLHLHNGINGIDHVCLVVMMLFVQAANERHVVLLLLLLCRRSLVADWLIDPSVGRLQHKLYGYVMPVLSNM